MREVRETEQKQKFKEGVQRKKCKIQHGANKIIIESVQEIKNEELSQEEADDVVIVEEQTEQVLVNKQQEEQVSVEMIKEMPKLKNETDEKPLISDFLLIQKLEHNNNVTIEFSSKLFSSSNENYNFEEYTSLIKHADNNLIYSCNYCVKAFGNCEILLKHLNSCHVCLICFNIFDNYNELNSHTKLHSAAKLKCPVCKRMFNSHIYRQHIKKQHFYNIPSFVTFKPHAIL